MGGRHAALALTLCTALVFLFLLDDANVVSVDDATAGTDQKLTCTTNPKSQYDDGLAFIHVAKAGGTSYRSFFQSLAKECGYHAYIDEFPLWKEMSDNERGVVSVYGGVNHLGYFDLLSSWPGYHHRTTKKWWLPHSMSGMRGDNGAKSVAYFTQLRHPLERARSDYYYAKGLGPIHHLFEETQKMNVSQWIANTEDGGQLSYFVPPADGDKEQRRCCFDRADLENAKQLLTNDFAGVGLVEEPTMTLDVLQCQVPWINKAIGRNSVLGKLQHLNVSPLQAESAASHDTSVDDAAVAKKFPLDWELYVFARELLQKRHNDCVKRGLIEA
mmetsp:Transcript_26486/g.76433  ORF Transcript_26486/g.76433 Transcript_26486/m.76433 type:complete len:329 (-) Transcript_26486:66-1052(-)|eukprot:CAMPEP_0181032040 /NCGR_PEP_ID=MMETSP1070-20121207/6538_1 /TAXON_ID=265543 /ORGANISM="Minutocellus polymorphus, Strain NH13" /LENGTH=328 /DNA_ID=CAMNT_0023109427 /DNA_START=84 /DNA_END=1070 /DNA_ORIENTATION=+